MEHNYIAGAPIERQLSCQNHKRWRFLSPMAQRQFSEPSDVMVLVCLVVMWNYMLLLHWFTWKSHNGPQTFTRDDVNNVWVTHRLWLIELSAQPQKLPRGFGLNYFQNKNLLRFAWILVIEYDFSSCHNVYSLSWKWI
jgi:hypothetical protein